MTEITHEALEALSKAATQARRAYELEPNTSTLTAFMNAENEFAWALAALYRTGQLILAQPSGDEVEGRVIADVVKWLRTGGHLQQRCSIQSACVLSNAATALETGEWRNAQSV